MKKRLISLLLTVLMVLSLFSGMSMSAYADNELVEHTMVQGETVLGVCNSIGINYYTCKNAIMSLNGLTDESQFRFISVGTVITLPATNAIAQTIASSGTTGTTTGTTPLTGTTDVGANAVAYYLIPYTMQRGETVYAVCNALGIRYST